MSWPPPGAAAHRPDDPQAAEQAQLAALVAATSDLVAILDPTGVVRGVSPSLERRVGLGAGELVGRPIVELVPETDAHRLGVLPPRRPDPGARPTATCHLRTSRDCEVLVEARVADLGEHGLVLTMREVGERRGLEQQLRRLARTDPVTGVANLGALRERLTTVLSTEAPSGALLVLDLDDFKLVNELYGHTHGDGLLVEAARRLELVASQFDGACVARLGGDEFALLLPDVTLQEARWVCAGLLNRLRQPVSLGPAEIEVGTSIGLVMLDSQHRDADAALRDSELAVYAAKAAGKNCWQPFDPAMHDDLVARLTLEGELAVALDQDQFELYYQPLVRLDGAPGLGLEALIRWHHPLRGFVPPDAFLAAAERGGALMHRLGAWVLRAACRQIVAWSRDLGPRALDEIAVNVSPRQLLDPHFAERVGEALAETGAEPHRLVLEITESTAMAPKSHEQLHALRTLGVRLAIDFGTGHSSLARLAALPVDALKVDRSFVHAIPAVGDAPLVRAMVAMAHSLGLSVVAEGIETERQRAYLADLGCEHGQGYLFSRPLSAPEVPGFVGRVRAG